MKNCKSSNLLVQSDRFQWKIVHACEGDTIFLVFSTYARIHYPDPGGGYGVMLPQKVVFPIASNCP